MRKKKYAFPFAALLAAIFASLCTLLPRLSFAHENYVLPKEQIQQGMGDWSLNVFDSLKSPANLRLVLTITPVILLVFILYYLFLSSKIGIVFDLWAKHFEPYGHAMLRIILSAAFFSSAYFNSFLGPEIPLSSLPGGEFLRPLLVITGVLLLLGFLSELAGLFSLGFIILATVVYKDYMFTYFNYYGEFIALVLFGSYFFSIDNLLKKKSRMEHDPKSFSEGKISDFEPRLPQGFGGQGGKEEVRRNSGAISRSSEEAAAGIRDFRAGKGVSEHAQIEKHKEWELPLIRITYGISILYPAITIKLLHPKIIVDIVEKYRMTDIHWLFPPDPLLISLGSGLSQIAVGLFIIFGFETRLASFITLVLYTLSILFFKEAVWPHYILLALAAYLTINDGGKWSIDNWIEKRRMKKLGMRRA
jgi:uncharacterized membrane protein YphA (DoxX/SURF4 family)